MSAQTVQAVDVIAAGLLDEADARALTTRIRSQLEHLDTLLLAAWRCRIWTALGHATWDAWVTAELGTVRLRLPVEQRRAVAAVWRREGMSQRAIATGLGVSKGTVAADLADVPVGEGLAVVVSLDGRRRPPVTPTAPSPAPSISKQAAALRYIAGRGECGATVPELMKATRWTQSQASACASRLNRALDDAGAPAVQRLGERRAGHAVYVLPAHVAGRWVLAPKQRIARN